MSNLNLKSAQVGTSTDPTKNFTLTAAQADGTLKLSRGNNGATFQDVMTVASTGKVDFPQLARQNSTNGYVTLPGGIILQWGQVTNFETSTWSAGTTNSKAFPVTFPIPFSSPPFVVLGNTGPITEGVTGSKEANEHSVSTQDYTTVGFNAWVTRISGAATVASDVFSVSWLAIGN